MVAMVGLTDILDGARQTQAFSCTDFSAEWTRPECSGGHFHAGIDLAAPLGTPVRAPRDGVIVPNLDPSHWIDLRSLGGGLIFEPYLGPNCVCLFTDAEHVMVEFGHLNVAYVNPGDRVKAGQPIGTVGTRGASTGPHLHLEVRTDASKQGPPWSAVLDPTPWLAYVKAPGIRHMRVIEDGHGIDYVTNGVRCRGIGNATELQDLLAMCGQTEPEKVGQYTRDRMVEVSPIPANETRPIVDRWAVADDLHRSAGFGSLLAEIQARLASIGPPAVHDIDPDALADSVATTLSEVQADGTPVW